MTTIQTRLKQHQQRLSRCRRCPAMHPRPVYGAPVASPVILIGQAPGAKEIEIHRPFAWTAGKTLFKWFARIGLDEQDFRQRVYMAAVCRCFPGKNPKGGDRVPSYDEIENCAPWLQTEIKLLQPQLVIPVGKLAIARFMNCDRLDIVIGKTHRISVDQRETDCIPLPHPSGASTWHRMEPGKSLLDKALDLINLHPAWHTVCAGPPSPTYEAQHA